MDRWTSPPSMLLFHRLNNQLGIILAHAELLEAKATDEAHRARAAQVVAGRAPGDRHGSRNQKRAIPPRNREFRQLLDDQRGRFRQSS